MVLAGKSQSIKKEFAVDSCHFLLLFMLTRMEAKRSFEASSLIHASELLIHVACDQSKATPSVLDGAGRSLQRCIGIPHAHQAPREAATAGGIEVGVSLDCCWNAQDGLTQLLQHTVHECWCNGLTEGKNPG